ncbi:hypothetical protein [Archangium sp.]|uniref:hypothetical protein n=1 Tax=Archangium sp. TaxID=1872627 RepID=UPI00286C3CF3|nr:hypothetical protein [Archangium sp.]
MTCRLSIPVLLLALASGGCGANREPCTDNCPDLSGVYAIEHASPMGDCAFSPYLVGPTVQLLQNDNGRRAVLHIIDPALRMELELTGDVYAPGPKDDPEQLGSFQMTARTVRSATGSDSRSMTLDVSASGMVSRRDDRRVLSATLSTADVASSKGCTVTLSFTGRGG